MKRAISLQPFKLTKTKEAKVRAFQKDALALANSFAKEACSSLMELHRKVYRSSKDNTSFNSQVICDIERTVCRTKGKFLKGITVKFNTPRNCKTFNTSKGTFCIQLGMYPWNKLNVPIKNNGNKTRYNHLINKGWVCKTYGLAPSGDIVAFFSKETTPIPERSNMLGIDINAKYLAITVLSPEGRTLYQTYFGKDIYVKRLILMQRKERLQSLADRGSSQARFSLGRLKKREKDFVYTKLGQTVKEIIIIAEKYHADIAIEDIKRFKSIGRRKANKKIMRIPFFKLRRILEARCFDKGIKLEAIDPYHTSKWCPNCGAVGLGHSADNYSLFKCKCGFTVNADRKASMAVAVKTLLERKNIRCSNQTTSIFQFSRRRVDVNLLKRPDALVSVCL